MKSYTWHSCLWLVNMNIWAAVVVQLLLCFSGAWILTNGLRFGITKHLGQAVRDHSLASTSSKVRVVAIGIAPWNMIHNREALLTAKVSTQIHNTLPLKATLSSVNNLHTFVLSWVFVHCYNNFHKVDEPAAYTPQDLPHGAVYSLDSHHSHFVLVEEDPNRPGATSEMRVKLLKHISLQRTGYGGNTLHAHICFWYRQWLKWYILLLFD